MKTFVIISCMFVVAVLIMNPVQAGGVVSVNISQAEYGDFWNRYSNVTMDESPQAICAAYGLSNGSYTNEPIGYALLGDPANTSWNSYKFWYGEPNFFNLSGDAIDALNYPTAYWFTTCADMHNYAATIHRYYNSTSEYPYPEANFTGTPLSGAAPLYVMFDDTSSNESGTCTYNWTITPASGVSAGATGTLENHAASFSVAGTYAVSHGVDCQGRSDIEEKADYITVYNATSDYITTHFVVMDEPRWAQLAGSTINMLDIENGSWVNVSPSATGYEGITTLSNHTISAFASMTGYNDDELLAQPAWSGGDYRLLLFPENYGNVSAGNVTVYVSVYDTDLSSNEGRVADAAVNMAYVSGSDRVNDYRITDDAGMVSFVVPNQTTIYLYAEKAGYTRGGTTISSGNGNGGSAAVYAEITIGRTTVTTAPTVTTLPGGGTPAPTVDPYPCDADHPENCKRKQTEMGNTLIQYGPQLLLLFIIATFVGVIKMMGK